MISSHGVTSKAGFADRRARRRDRHALQRHDLLRAAVFDLDLGAGRRLGVESRLRRDDEERHVGVSRAEREPERADLVRGVAVRGDAVGAGDDDVGGAAREQRRRGGVDDEAVGRAEPLQLPRGQARALQQRPRLEHERLFEPARLVQRLDDGERRPALDGREAAGVADRHRANAAVADELAARARPHARPSAVTPRSPRPGSRAPRRAPRRSRRAARAATRSTIRARFTAVGRAFRSDRTAAAKSGSDSARTTPNAPATPMRRRPADGEPADRVDERRDVLDAQDDELVRQSRLVDQLDGAVDPVDRPRHAITIRAHGLGSGRSRAVRAGDAAAGRRPVARAARRRQLVGQDGVARRHRARRRRDLRQGHRPGHGDDHGRRLPAASPRAAARAARARGAQRLRRWFGELAAARLDPSAPQPSVEALLHAFLPYPAVLHTHADAIVTLTNTADGERLVRDVFGDALVVIPYVMPGFDLAREVRRLWPEQAHDGTVGMVLLNHGLFTFGATSREAYEQHLELIAIGTRAGARGARRRTRRRCRTCPLTELADLRRAISDAAGRPMIVQRHTDADVRRFVSRDDLASLATRGPLTPEHVIRTKRTPLVGRDVGVVRARLRGVLRAARARGPDDARPCAARRARSGARHAHRRRDGARRADRRGRLPPHDPGARGGRGRARRLRRAPARAAVRRRVLGARAGEAAHVDARRRRSPARSRSSPAPPRGSDARRREALAAAGAAVAGLDLDPVGAPACPSSRDVTDAAAVGAALARDGRDVRRRRHRRARRRRLRRERSRRGSGRRELARDDGRERRRLRAAAPRAPSPARAIARRRPRRRRRLEERRRAGPRRRRLLGVEGGADAARPRRGARVGAGRDPRQRRASRRGLRHGAVDAGAARRARRARGRRRRDVQAAEPARARDHVRATSRAPSSRSATTRSARRPARRSRSTAATSA